MPLLTVQVNDAEGPANGVEVVVQLAASDRLRAGGAEVTNDPIVRHTNLAGVATFDIHGTEELVGQSLYSIRVARARPVSFAMPSVNRHLNDILTSPQPTTPGNLPSAGTYAQPTAPPNPAPGTIWFDTSQSPPLGQWWDGDSWEDLAQSSGGGLNAAAVDARIKPYARTGGRTIQTADIGNVQITNQKIAGATLDNRVMARDAIDTDNIQDDAVTRAKIADDAIDADRIAAGAVGSSEIADDSITNAKLRNDTIEEGKLANTVTNQFVPGGGTTGEVLKKRSNTAYDTEWAADAGGLSQSQVDARVAAGVKDYAETGGRQIQTGDIGNDQITQGKLADDSVGSDQLAAGAVNAAAIGNNVVSENKLAQAVTDQFVPAGGTNDQLLAKASNSDYDTEWVDAPSGGGGSSSLVGLSDTPSSLGTQGEILAVAAGGATTEWVGQAMAGLDTQTVVAYRTYAASPSGGQNSAGIQLPADWATGTSFLYILGGNSATQQGVTMISISRLSATTTGTNVTVGNLSVSGVGAMTVRWTPGTRTISIRAFGGSQTPRIQEVLLIRSAAATGSGLSQSQVDARVQALVENFAEVGNAATIPPAKLASGGTTGQVLKRTATGQEWAADAGGLNQAAVDARVSAGVKAYARTGGRQIQSGDIGTGQVGSAQIADATIVSGDIASDAITSANLAPNSVGASELANNAVDTGAIADDAVTQAKIANDAVGNDQIANDAVRAAQIQAGAVGTSELANDAVTAAKIDTDAVGSSEIASGAVGTSELANNAVTPAQVHSTLASRLVPAGGNNDQILAKSADADYATEWIDAPSGGTGGTPLTVTPLESSFTPSLAATTIASVGETQLNIAAGTIATNHPFSVSSNGIVVAAGTSPFQATFDVVVEVDPTGYVNNATAGGNRLFFDIYLKKDGTIMPASRTSQYMRAHEGWAATIHKTHLTFTDMLSPGTYTLWFYRSVAAGSGNEVNAIQINASGSTIVINSERYTGGGGTGTDTFLELTDTPAAFGTAGQSLRVNTARNQLEFYTPASGGGLTQSQVDARIATFARAGNTDMVPVAKLASGGSDGQVLTRTATGQAWEAGAESWARQGISGTIPTARLGDQSITAGKILNNSLGALQIAAEGVGTSELANLAVTAGKLAADAVTNIKIATNAVRTGQIADDAVTIDKIANAVVNRLLPSTSGTAAQVLTWPQTGTTPIWAAASGGLTINELQAATTWENAPAGDTTTRPYLIGTPFGVNGTERRSSGLITLPTDYTNSDFLLVVTDNKGIFVSPLSDSNRNTRGGSTYDIYTTFTEAALTGTTANTPRLIQSQNDVQNRYFKPRWTLAGTAPNSTFMFYRVRYGGIWSYWVRYKWNGSPFPITTTDWPLTGNNNVGNGPDFSLNTPTSNEHSDPYFRRGFTNGATVDIQIRLGYLSGGLILYNNVDTLSRTITVQPQNASSLLNVEQTHWITTDTIPQTNTGELGTNQYRMFNQWRIGSNIYAFGLNDSRQFSAFANGDAQLRILYAALVTL